MLTRPENVRILISLMEKIASRANEVLEMLVKNFTCRDVDFWKQLYKSHVRPQ